MCVVFKFKLLYYPTLSLFYLHHLCSHPLCLHARRTRRGHDIERVLVAVLGLRDNRVVLETLVVVTVTRRLRCDINKVSERADAGDTTSGTLRTHPSGLVGHLTLGRLLVSTVRLGNHGIGVLDGIGRLRRRRAVVVLPGLTLGLGSSLVVTSRELGTTEAPEPVRLVVVSDGETLVGHQLAAHAVGDISLGPELEVDEGTHERDAVLIGLLDKVNGTNAPIVPECLLKGGLEDVRVTALGVSTVDVDAGRSTGGSSSRSHNC